MDLAFLAAMLWTWHQLQLLQWVQYLLLQNQFFLCEVFVVHFFLTKNICFSLLHLYVCLLVCSSLDPCIRGVQYLLLLFVPLDVSVSFFYTFLLFSFFLDPFFCFYQIVKNSHKKSLFFLFFFSFINIFLWIYESWGSVGCLVAADGKTLKNASASAGLEPKCTGWKLHSHIFNGGLPRKRGKGSANVNIFGHQVAPLALL